MANNPNIYILEYLTNLMTQKATDRELADFLIYHITNPCVEPQTGLNIRQFYIREAERVMATFQDSDAKKLLESHLNQYSNE